MHEHSISQFSRKRLTPFERCFVIMDQFDASKHLQRPKTFRCANQSRQFQARLSSPMLCADSGQLSISQFSKQPPTPFKSRFDFPDRFNTSEHLQRPKTFRGANRRRRFRARLSSPHPVHQHSISQLSRERLTPFELRFVFLDRFNTSKHFLQTKIFRRTIPGCQI